MSTSPQNPDDRPPRARDRGVPSYDPGLFDDPDQPGGPADPLGPSVRIIPARGTPTPTAGPPRDAAGSAATVASPGAATAAGSAGATSAGSAAGAASAGSAAGATSAGSAAGATSAGSAAGADNGPDTGPDLFAGGAAARRPPTVDTGRLYRSARAEGTLARDAIPALATGEQSSVWTKGAHPGAAARTGAAAAAGVAAGAVPNGVADDAGPTTSDTSGSPAPAAAAPVAAGDPVVGGDDDVIPDDPDAGPMRGWVPLSPYLAASGSSAREGRRGPEQRPGAHRSEGPVAATQGQRPDADDVAAPAPTPSPTSGGLTWTGVTVVMVLVTVALGFAQVLVRPDDTVWFIAGGGYALATLYCALTVRLTDLWAAFVVPPLAWLVALLTAGQLTLGSSGSLVIREGLMIFGGLALNAPWIVGSAVVALVVILVRRTRARRAGLL